MKIDYWIVGAGYAGCILAERIATQLNKKVLIIEQRNHIAGNAFDFFNEEGILVHKYGPHIFHTSNQTAWQYLSQFTEWRPYFHNVLAVIEGIKVPIPFNFNSIYELFPNKYAEKIENILLENYGYGHKIPILQLRETENKDLKFLADYIYENVFLGYTTKQWGFTPEQLDASVSARVPVYLSRDNRYFQDTYQGIPKNGYTQMFQNMINHQNIHLMLNTNYKDVINDLKFDKLVFTGALDDFFDNLHGELPYRSLDFKFVSEKREFYQEVAQINYPNNHLYTRITEFKHLTGQKSDTTTYAYEYPQEYVKGVNVPYYPIPMQENHEKFDKYLREAKKLKNVFFVGRLADYKYYNMDQITITALQKFEKVIAK